MPISLSDPDHTAIVIHPFHSSADAPTGKEFSSYMAGLDMLPSLLFAELSHCSVLKELRWEIRSGARMGNSSTQLLPLQKTDVSSFPFLIEMPAGLVYQWKKLPLWVQWVLISLHHRVLQRYPAWLLTNWVSKAPLHLKAQPEHRSTVLSSSAHTEVDPISF